MKVYSEGREAVLWGISRKMYAESLYVFMQNQMCIHVSDLCPVSKHRNITIRSQLELASEGACADDVLL